MKFWVVFGHFFGHFRTFWIFTIKSFQCLRFICDDLIPGTLKQKIHIPKTTEQIWFSFSKGWGLIGQRAGLIFTKQPHKSLHPMKRVEAWNYTSVEVALAIVENYDIDTVASEYKPVQQRLCQQYNLEPSDCFFIATSTDDEYKERRRTKNLARLDLSYLMNGEIGE